MQNTHRNLKPFMRLNVIKTMCGLVCQAGRVLSHFKKRADHEKQHIFKPGGLIMIWKGLSLALPIYARVTVL